MPTVIQATCLSTRQQRRSGYGVRSSPRRSRSRHRYLRSTPQRRWTSRSSSAESPPSCRRGSDNGGVTSEQIDYLAANQAAWEAQSDSQLVLARRNWSSDPNWGIFGIPETDVGLLPA